MEEGSPFAKSLASNDKSERDQTLRALKTYVARLKGAGLSELDLLKLWKGLFYCMWMSDKTAVQQELAREIASLLPVFKSSKAAHLFAQCFFKTMRREWQGLDHLRLDKYYSLIRRIVYEWLRFLCVQGWERKVMESYSRVMLEEVLMHKPDSLRCHVLDVFVPELERLQAESEAIGVTPAVLQALLEPFYEALRRGLNPGMSKHFYRHLLKQVFKPLVATSKLALKGLQVNLFDITKAIFAIAADAQVSGPQRSMLYELHKELRVAAKLQGTYRDEREEQVGKNAQGIGPEKRETGLSGESEKKDGSAAVDDEGKRKKRNGSKVKKAEEAGVVEKGEKQVKVGLKGKKKDEVKKPRKSVSTLQEQKHALSLQAKDTSPKKARKKRKKPRSQSPGKEKAGEDNHGGSRLVADESASSKKRARNGASGGKLCVQR